MADARENLKQAGNEVLTVEKAREYFGAVIEVDKHFKCSNCGRNNTVRVPNVTALAELLNQGNGKPPETQKLEVDVTHRVLAELEGMSDAELARRLSAKRERRKIEEGEWRELPPAA